MNDTNQGWKQQDEYYLRKFDNAQADPDMQVLVKDNWEDENKELGMTYNAVHRSTVDVDSSAS